LKKSLPLLRLSGRLPSISSYSSAANPSLLQARKILTQWIYGMVDKGECDEQRLTVGGLVHLKAHERDHAIKSAQNAPAK
jgi:hypothetical protein